MKYVFRGNYWHSNNNTQNMLIMCHDLILNNWDLAYISGNLVGGFPICMYLFINRFAYE